MAMPKESLRTKAHVGPAIVYSLILLRFLIAEMHMKLLFGQVNLKKLKAALNKLPENLSDMYETVMKIICAQEDDQKTIATAALIWITYAKRRLNVHELLHAIAIHLDEKITDIDAEVIPFAFSILVSTTSFLSPMSVATFVRRNLSF